MSEEIFLSLQGRWHLKRLTNGYGKMKGIASFSPLNGDHLSLFYREEGEYTLQNGSVVSFFKEYIYCLNQDHIEVYFTHDKKRGFLFYRLVFSEKTKPCLARGEHYCAKDIYRATYQFIDSETFTLEYMIHGPQKNLKIHTLFQKDVP